MLQLSKHQVEAFKLASFRRFHNQLCQYFRSLEYNPQRIVDTDIALFVDDAISKGHRAGLTVEESLQRFSLACWYIGTDTILADRVIAGIFSDDAVGELDQADAILERALALLGVD